MRKPRDKAVGCRVLRARRRSVLLGNKRLDIWSPHPPTRISRLKLTAMIAELRKCIRFYERTKEEFKGHRLKPAAVVYVCLHHPFGGDAWEPTLSEMRSVLKWLISARAYIDAEGRKK